MTFLLKYQGYPPAVLVALLLHGIILYFLLGSSMAPANYVDVDRPTYINASVIQNNPQRLRRLDLLELQRAAEQRALDDAAERTRAEQERVSRLALERTEREQRELLESREREEKLSRAREEQQRLEQEEQQRLEQLVQQQAERDAEAARRVASQRQAQQLTADNQAVAAYIAIIHDTVAPNWSVPPSARNGMTVVLRIRLVPTGEVVDVNIIQESGNAAFDRSAQQAVLKAGRFPELQNMSNSLFEREFRTFNLLFRPEDLFRD